MGVGRVNRRLGAVGHLVDRRQVLHVAIGTGLAGHFGAAIMGATASRRRQPWEHNACLVTAWGSGQLSTPAGVAVDATNAVYVADSGNHLIQQFDPDGRFLAAWGQQGSGRGQFNRPYAVAVGAAGYVYVADALNNRIQKFAQCGLRR